MFISYFVLPTDHFLSANSINGKEPMLIQAPIVIKRYRRAHIDWLEQKPDWKGLAAIGRVETTRIIGHQTTVESRYYLCSFVDLGRLAQCMRNKTNSAGC